MCLQAYFLDSFFFIITQKKIEESTVALIPLLTPLRKSLLEAFSVSLLVCLLVTLH